MPDTQPNTPAVVDALAVILDNLSISINGRTIGCNVRKYAVKKEAESERLTWIVTSGETKMVDSAYGFTWHCQVVATIFIDMANDEYDARLEQAVRFEDAAAHALSLPANLTLNDTVHNFSFTKGVSGDATQERGGSEWAAAMITLDTATYFAR